MTIQLNEGTNTTGIRTRAAILATLLCAWAAFSASSASAQACVPDCRDGYTCHRGQCISACNPGCGEGEVCSAGQCLSAEPVASVQYRSSRPVRYEDVSKPSVAVPAAFVGVGGFLLIAGGVTFGTSEYDDFGYWTGGHYAGVGLMTLGAISLISATPLLAIRAKEKREWERSTRGRTVRDLAVAPQISPTGPSKHYGVSLRGRF